MTKKQKNLMQSMLNYYEVDMKGIRSEKMNPREKAEFIETFNRNYEMQILKEVASKIINKLRGNNPPPEQNFPFKKDAEDFDNYLEKFDPKTFDEGGIPEEDMDIDGPEFPEFPESKLNFSKENSKDVDKEYLNEVSIFINWLNDMLKKEHHQVMVFQSHEPDGSITIKLMKTKSGKR